MSKVIFKLKFQSPNFKKTKMNNMYHLIYIGTRDGVALNDDMKEIEGNYNKSNNDEYIKYISDRPRSHGLFGKEKNIDLKEMSEYMKNYNGYVYRGIVSLKEDDAIEKGFDEKENWEMLVRDKMLYISKQLNIRYDKLNWVGAFHRESGHPHIHLMIWNTDNEIRNIGVIPKKNIENIRKEFTKEIFNNEIENVLSLKNIYRDFLTDTTKGIDNADYNKEFLEVNKKIDEINTKYDIKKYEEKIIRLNKEIIESDNEEDTLDKKAEIEELKIKIDEAREKIKVYDLRETIKGLENQKEFLKLKEELKSARALGKINQYEDYIYQIKAKTGMFNIQKDKKICSNKKEVINVKCKLVDLINKKKMLEIKNTFKEKDIDLIDDKLLTPEELKIKEEYLKLKLNSEHIEIVEIETLEEEIFNLSNVFDKNKWKLDIENEMTIFDNGNEYIDKDFVKEVNKDLDNSINNYNKKIKDIYNKLLDEIVDNIEIGTYDINIKGKSLSELEDELKELKKEYKIDDIEKRLEKFKINSSSKASNEKIIELENKINDLEKDLENASSENIDYIKNEIEQLNDEVNIEKEKAINKEIEKLNKELKKELEKMKCISDKFNEFILEDKITGKTLEEIGEMIEELEVPKDGRLQYKFMPPEVKSEIDKITDKILEIPQYRKMFNGYIKSVEDLSKIYTNKDEDIEEARNNAKEDIYKRIGNNILKTKKEIVVDNKKTDFAVQQLFSSIAKLFSQNTNRNKKTRVMSNDKSKLERKKLYQESKAKGLYSEQELE